MTTDKQHQDDVKVEEILLDDGRHAEKRVVVDEKGNQVVEIFAEQRMPLKLEKRIVCETKNIVVKEIHQMLDNGKVVSEEVFEVSPEAFALTKNVVEKQVSDAPVSKFQEVVEQNVENKNKKDKMVNMIMIAVIAVQVVLLLGYLLLT
jgi:hypothetical protein